jgi:hypothetical protein
MARLKHSRAWWEEELRYILGVDKTQPGPSFRGEPSVFKEYCYMQADMARTDGFEDITQQIIKHCGVKTRKNPASKHGSLHSQILAQMGVKPAAKKKPAMKTNPLQPHKKGDPLPLTGKETLPYLVQEKINTRWQTVAGFHQYDEAAEWGKKHAAKFPALHIRVATY